MAELPRDMAIQPFCIYMRTIIDKNTREIIRKTLAGVLVGVFLFTSTIGWAEEERLSSARTEGIAFSSHPADNTKLAPPSKLNSDEFKYSLTVAAICNHVERDGNLDDKSYLNDVSARLGAMANPQVFEKANEASSKTTALYQNPKEPWFGEGLSKIAGDYNGNYAYSMGDLVIHNGKGILLLGGTGAGKTKLAHALIMAGAKYGGSDGIDLLRIGDALIGGVNPEQLRNPLRYRTGNAGFEKDSPTTDFMPAPEFVPIDAIVVVKMEEDVSEPTMRSYTSLPLSVQNNPAINRLLHSLGSGLALNKVTEIGLPPIINAENAKSLANKILLSTSNNITVLQYEIIIEIPNEGLAIRYFDPTKANVVTPYSDISKLSTKAIGPRLHRQIIHRIKALPAPAKDVPPNNASMNSTSSYRTLQENNVLPSFTVKTAYTGVVAVPCIDIGQTNVRVNFVMRNLLDGKVDQNKPIAFENIAEYSKKVEELRRGKGFIQNLLTFVDDAIKQGQAKLSVNGTPVVLHIGIGATAAFNADGGVYPGTATDLSELEGENLIALILGKIGKRWKASVNNDGVVQVNYLAQQFLNSSLCDKINPAALKIGKIIGFVPGTGFGAGGFFVNDRRELVPMPGPQQFYDIKLPNDKIPDDFCGSWFAEQAQRLGFSSAETMSDTLKYPDNPKYADVAAVYQESAKAFAEIIKKTHAGAGEKTTVKYPEFWTNVKNTSVFILGGLIVKTLQIKEIMDKAIRAELKGLPVEIVYQDDILADFASTQYDTEKYKAYVGIISSSLLIPKDELQNSTELEAFEKKLEDIAEKLGLKDRIKSGTKFALHIGDNLKIGDPSGSKTHEIFNAAFTTLDKDIIYLPYEVPENDVSKFEQIVRLVVANKKIIGFDTGAPFKLHIQGAIPHINIQRGGEETGIDFVYKDLEGNIFGGNWNGDAWARWHESQFGRSSLKDKRVVILGGCGPTGVSIATSLLERKIVSLCVTDINMESGKRVTETLKSKFTDIPIEFIEADDRAIALKVSEADIIINATGVGKKDASQSPLSDEVHKTIRQGTHVMDLNYRPHPTNAFLEKSRNNGAIIFNGTGLMIFVNTIHAAKAIIASGEYPESAFDKLLEQISCAMSLYAEENGLNQGALKVNESISKTAPPASGMSPNATSPNFTPALPSVIEGERRSSSGIIEKIDLKMHEYITKAKIMFKDMLGEDKPYTLLRVPVEAIESVGIDNIKDFLTTFQEAPNGYVELYYMSGVSEVTESVYQKYGLRKKALPAGFKRTRENTVTLFAALKGEEINQSIIVSRLGSINITPENTILSPIGLQHDPAGLVRATILGLKIMGIARQIKGGKTIDRDAIHVEILNQLRDVIDPSDFKNFNLTPDDIIALATGNINNILTALKKLIKLLPITPINAEELRQIYEHAKAVITAA